MRSGALISLERDISPPPKAKVRSRNRLENRQDEERASDVASPTPAAIEAGKVLIDDHLQHFSNHLSKVSRISNGPRLNVQDMSRIYLTNQRTDGRHFVVHQHDHPISGVHYDLRLQFSSSSTISFAIPYGLPGNPNSSRPNRLAVETRVHNLWNNIVESASHVSGSLLIWDTGEYEVLPRQAIHARMTDDELSAGEVVHSQNEGNCKDIASAFQSRRMRLRLHGTRLPLGYTIVLRLPTRNDCMEKPRRPKRKRRRLDPAKVVEIAKQAARPISSDEGEPGTDTSDVQPDAVGQDVANASDNEAVDQSIRLNNAYPGASNTIGSVHQRLWFVTLDKRGSGFEKVRYGPDRGRWTGKWEPFFVRGREHERSVVTGRLADDVMSDESVKDFAARKMWRPILE